VDQETLVQRILRETLSKFSELRPEDAQMTEKLAEGVRDLRFKDADWITCALSSPVTPGPGVGGTR
jgi:hypothetical protein